MKKELDENDIYKDGEFMGIIIGGLVFAVAFLIFSVI